MSTFRVNFLKLGSCRKKASIQQQQGWHFASPWEALFLRNQALNSQPKQILLFCGILCLTAKQEVDFLFPEDANQVRFKTGHLDINGTNNRRKLKWNRAQASFKWLNMLIIFGTPLFAKCIHVLENLFENKIKACYCVYGSRVYSFPFNHAKCYRSYNSSWAQSSG